MRKLILTNHELELLHIAKKFIAINENLVLTGSLMCKIRGIDLNRECHDLDLLLIQDFATNVKQPLDLNLIEKGYGSDGTSIKYAFNDIEIDILSTHDETFEIINGIKLSSLKELYNAKIAYSNQNNDSIEKHLKDIEIIKNYITNE